MTKDCTIRTGMIGEVLSETGGGIHCLMYCGMPTSDTFVLAPRVREETQMATYNRPSVYYQASRTEVNVLNHILAVKRVTPDEIVLQYLERR